MKELSGLGCVAVQWARNPCQKAFFGLGALNKVLKIGQRLSAEHTEQPRFGEPIQVFAWRSEPDRRLLNCAGGSGDFWRRALAA